MRIQNHVEGYDRGVLPPVIPALLAQPIVETCLRIPTWDWCRGGINRAIAREAFSTALPARVIARRSKSGPESLTAEVRSEEHTSELQSLMRISYAVFFLKKKKKAQE